MNEPKSLELIEHEIRELALDMAGLQPADGEEYDTAGRRLKELNEQRRIILASAPAMQSAAPLTDPRELEKKEIKDRLDYLTRQSQQEPLNHEERKHFHSDILELEARMRSLEREETRLKTPGSEESALDAFLSSFSFATPVKQIFEFLNSRLPKLRPEGVVIVTPRMFYWATGLCIESIHESPLEDELVATLVPFQHEELEKWMLQENSFARPSFVGKSRTIVTREMYEVAGLAKDFAIRATGSPKIHLRHLLAMILKFRNPDEYLFFQRHGVDAYSLISEFAKSPAGDNEQAWNQEVRSFTRKTIQIQNDRNAANESQLSSEEEATFRSVVDRRRFSSGMARIVWRAFEDFKPAADSGVTTGVPPIAIFLALLAQGWTESQTTTTSLPGLLVRNLGLKNNQIATARKRLLMVEPLSPQKSTVGPSAEIETLFDEMSALASDCSLDGIIAARHSVAVLLSWSRRANRVSTGLQEAGFSLDTIGAALTEHLERYQSEDKPGEWQRAIIRLGLHGLVSAPDAMAPHKSASIPSQSALNFGGTDSFDREATTKQSCLRVEDYADALRYFFSKAGSGELCFALYGHWGRGKTYLMRKVKEALAKEQYETVFFSAWKYPGTPEVWVHLYETIADHACCGNFLKVMPRIIRSGISKNGPWPLILALASLTFGLVPKIYLAEHVLLWVKALWGLLGLGGLIWVGEFMFGIRKTAKRLSHDFLTTSHHIEKLGLQATIGKDLESVLVGWMPQGRFKFGLATLMYFLIVMVFSWSAWHWLGFLKVFLAQHPNLEFYTNLHSHPIFQLGFTVGAAALGAGLFAWVFSESYSPNRILLVIDDLDRCNPGQLLSVVESIKLLLEDNEISKRVQVAMLVEEDILRQAVHKKYVTELGLADIKKFDKDRVVDENLEKLFTTHLRLPSLNEEDFREILRKVLELDEKAYAEILKKINAISSVVGTQKTAPPSTKLRATPLSGQPSAEVAPTTNVGSAASTAPEPTSMVQQSISKPTIGTPPESLPSQPQESTWESGFVFSDDEKEAFIAIIPVLRELNLPWGPRSIRAFTFRYQLARLILRRLKLPMPRPITLLNALIDAMKRDRTDDKYDSEVLKIIHQVS